jgi:hypothetical protein
MRTNNFGYAHCKSDNSDLLGKYYLLGRNCPGWEKIGFFRAGIEKGKRYERQKGFEKTEGKWNLKKANWHLTIDNTVLL